MTNPVKTESPSDSTALSDSAALSEQPKLLIVEDDEELRTQMKWALVGEYDVYLAGNRRDALAVLRKEHPAVVTLDLGLPPDGNGVEEGFAALERILEEAPSTKVLVVTGRYEREHARTAIRTGAYDFFTKPIDPDELRRFLERAFYIAQLEAECQELRSSGTSQQESFEGMLGRSPEILEVFSRIERVANADVSVLITGENGTGKELVARAIHRRSKRKEGPFVAINCGAIPETLLESELFGHERGAFTGAHAQRKGRMEMANGGTLFLDEIGEFPVHLQTKLLRALEEHEIERLGGERPVPLDVRVLAATNRDIGAARKEGNFREDLFHRLAVITIDLPPLRDRGEDILHVANALLKDFASEHDRRITGFSPEAVRAIHTYGWPGNVRELSNRINRAVIMAEGNRITAEDLELGSASSSNNNVTLKEAREAVEKEVLEAAMARNHGNLTRTAKDLGISRPALYDLMDKLGMRRTNGN